MYFAIQEFLEAGFAHLDIRVPNICFKKEKEWMAVLIDLDQSLETYEVNMPGYDIENSIMHNQKFDTLEKYDWRQFALMLAKIAEGALMLAKIAEGNNFNYHTQGPVFTRGSKW